MVAFVVFWAALFAAIFFLMSTVLKGILAILQGGAETLGWAVLIAFFGGGAAFVLWLLASIVQAITTGTFWSIVGYIVLFLVAVSIIIGMIGSIGAVIIEIALTVAGVIIELATNVFTWIYNLFENAYIFFLKVIDTHLEKC